MSQKDDSHYLMQFMLLTLVSKGFWKEDLQCFPDFLAGTSVDMCVGCPHGIVVWDADHAIEIPTI